MSTKFEQLLDYLVNEETDKANELFHEIVVEKSRDIYESLIAEEEEEDKMEEASEEDDEAVEEASEDEDDEAMEEGYEEEAVESIFGEADDEEFPVQDQTDDMEADVAAPEMSDEMGDEDSSAPADKGDIQDLEDALEELKAEFEALMAAEKNEEENEPGVHDDEEGESPLDSAEDEEEGEEEKKEGNPFAEGKIARTQGEKMREYIEKVSQSMVDGEGVGSGRGDLAGQTGHDSGKSPISSGAGKPTSGAKAISASSEKHSEDGTSPKGKVGGLVKTGGDFVKAGTKNVASSANSKKPDGSKLTSVSKPGNAEGKPVGAGTGQSNVTGATNTKSIESGK
jgi:chemotaxis protein histidine kinase CheA